MSAKAWEKMHEYQREGARWMFELYQEGVGGILGDEMGLGKTAQLCMHFGALAQLQDRMLQEELEAAGAGRRRQQTGAGAGSRAFYSGSSSSAIFLIVCPATVLGHWRKELTHWSPAMRIVLLHSVSRTGAELAQLGNDGEAF